MGLLDGTTQAQYYDSNNSGNYGLPYSAPHRIKPPSKVIHNWTQGGVDKFWRGMRGQHKPTGGYPHSSQISEIRTETYKIKKYFIEARYVFKLSPIWMRRKH